MMIVHPVQPSALNQDLSLRPIDARVQLFSNEAPTAGEVARPAPFPIQQATIPAGGLQCFVQGAAVSAALRDTGYQLQLSGIDLDPDEVRLTVVQFSNLRVAVPSTQPRTARPAFANAPVPAHALVRGAMFVARDFDEDYANNPPLVLIEGSLPAGATVSLAVAVAPANVPVSWSAERDDRPAPDGDAPSVVALSPRAVPTIATVAGTPTEARATLQLDAVGSFRVRPFVDGNGNNVFDRGVGASLCPARSRSCCST
jgi:hypothetical protein